MKKVMVVEDDESFQFLCEMVFRRSGRNVTLIQAFDGLEAIEKLASMDELPDLILLDINMPRMNGHEFLEAYAKRNPSKIPVVAMLTSSDQQRDRQNAMSYSFVKDYILKPLEAKHIEAFEAMCEELSQVEVN